LRSGELYVSERPAVTTKSNKSNANTIFD